MNNVSTVYPNNASDYMVGRPLQRRKVGVEDEDVVKVSGILVRCSKQRTKNLTRRSEEEERKKERI